MKTKVILLAFLSFFIFTEIRAGAVTGSRNKCFNVGKRFNAHANLRYLIGVFYYYDKRNGYDCNHTAEHTIIYNGAYAYARSSIYYPTSRITVSKWNAVAGDGYTIPITEPPDSYGLSVGSNGESVVFDSVNHAIQISDFNGYIAATLGTNYGSTLLYVVWKPGFELDSIINEREVINRGKVSIENGQLLTDGIFSQSDYNLTVDIDTTSFLPVLKAIPVNLLSKTIPIDTSLSLDSVKVSIFCEGGYGTFNEEDIIVPEPMILDVKLFLEGYYMSGSNMMSSGDSIKIYIHNSSPPYIMFDSAVSVIRPDGNGTFEFYREDPCCRTIKIKQKSSIETWASGIIDNGTSHMYYDFTTSSSQAFGSNMIQVDSAPIAFAIYSGDVNQDGTIDLTDGSLIDNDALNFASGYLTTDLNGDGIIDVADAVFADNNAFNFVSKITP